jgi:hypothetical protein
LICACLTTFSIVPQVVLAKQPTQLAPLPTPIAVDDGGGGRIPVDQQGPTTQIYGGTNAAPGSYYFHAGIINSTNPDYPYCGGTLIAAEWVVTASHCLEANASINPSSPTASRVQVLLGAYDRTQTGSPGRQIKTVLQLTRHPSLTASLLYDIALLKIQPAQINNAVAPIGIVLGFDPWPALNAYGYILGWGYTTNSCNVPLANTLQQLSVAVEDFPRPDTIFLKSRVAGAHPCSGDSGGSFSTQFVVSCPRGWPASQTCYSRRLAGVESAYFSYIRISTPNISSWICGTTNNVVQGCDGR